MKKCMVMYVSSTGNTEQMAAAIAEQALSLIHISLLARAEKTSSKNK